MIKGTLWCATKEERLTARWFPKGSLKIEHPDGLGVVYVSQYGGPRITDDAVKKWYQIVGYRGTSGKAEFNYRMPTREKAEKYVGEWFESLTAHAKMVAARRIPKPHTFKSGDIVTNSWGYDQTNVDWYRVTRTTTNFVWLKPIAAHVVEDGFMSGPSKPFVDTSSADPAKWSFQDLEGTEKQHKAEGNRVCMKYGSGSKWDGRPMHCSWYA